MNRAPLIQVQNAQRKLRLEMEPLREFARRAWEECCALAEANADAVRDLAEVNVALVSDRRMAALHQRFMQIAGPTDVLTFQHGEVVVSVETAQANAARFRSSPDEEIRLYIIHGFLHLLGFDDQSAADARAMEAAQTRVLKALRRPNDRSPRRASV